MIFWDLAFSELVVLEFIGYILEGVIEEYKK